MVLGLVSCTIRCPIDATSDHMTCHWTSLAAIYEGTAERTPYSFPATGVQKDLNRNLYKYQCSLYLLWSTVLQPWLSFFFLLPHHQSVVSLWIVAKSLQQFLSQSRELVNYQFELGPDRSSPSWVTWRRSPSEISLLHNTTFLCVFLNADNLVWERKISPFYLFTWIFINFQVSTSDFTGTLWTRNSENSDFCPT